MRAIRFSQDIRPLSEFRAHAAEFIRHVRSTRRPLVLTQHGRGAAVLLDVAEYERLLERAEVLEDIAVAEQQLTAGQSIAHEDAKAQVFTRLAK